MKVLQIMFMCISISLISCQDDNQNDPTEDDMPEDLTLLSELKPMINGDIELNFAFDECNFDLFGDQKPLNSFGFRSVNSVIWNTKTLQTRLYSNDQELGIYLAFLEEQSSDQDTVLLLDQIENILEGDINNKESSHIGFEIQLRYGDKTYVSTQRNFEFDGSNNAFNYYENFNYDIVAMYDYTSDCNEEKTIKLSGNLNGKLFNIANGVISDSISIDLPEFELLLLAD